MSTTKNPYKSLVNDYALIIDTNTMADGRRFSSEQGSSSSPDEKSEDVTHLESPVEATSDALNGAKKIVTAHNSL